MVLLLATMFIGLVAMFGLFLMFANPENIERPFLVGAMTTLTSLVAGWLIWLEWHQGVPGRTGSSIAFALLSASGFALGRAIDSVLGPKMHTADERQATLGADLAD